MESAYDPYAFVRNAYLQHRDFKVSGGRSQKDERDEEEREQRMLEESGQDEGAPPTPH